MPFTCSICGEESTRICARCTKDSCNNHLCEKCLCCSDCCECEVVLAEAPRPMVHPVHRPVYGEDAVDELDDVKNEIDEAAEDDGDDVEEVAVMATPEEAPVETVSPVPTPPPSET